MAARETIDIVIGAKDLYSAQLHKAQSSFDKLGAGAGKALSVGAKAGAAALAIAATAAIAAGKAIWDLTNKSAAMGDEFQKASQRTGISAQTLSELSYAAKTSGADLASVETSLKILARRANDATTGLATAKRSFEQLGISATDSAGNVKSTESLFKEISESLKTVQSETKRAALAQELFGRRGTQILPLLLSDMQDVQNEARLLGITFSDIEANQAAAFQDAMERVQSAMRGVGNTIGKEFTPTLAILADEFAWFVAENKDHIQNWSQSFLEIFLYLRYNVPYYWNLLWANLREMYFATATLLGNSIKHILGIELFDTLDTAQKALEAHADIMILGTAKTLYDVQQEVARNTKRFADYGRPEFAPPAEAKARGKSAGKAYVDGIKEAIEEAPLAATMTQLFPTGFGEPGGIPFGEIIDIESLPEYQMFQARSLWRSQELEEIEEFERAKAELAKRGVMMTDNIIAIQFGQAKLQEGIARFRTETEGAASMALEEQMISLMETGRFSMRELGKRLAYEVRANLTAMAAQSAVRAIFLAAEALAALALGQPTQAAALATAAGMHASIAGAALVGAAAMSKIPKPESERGEQNKFESRARRDYGERERRREEMYGVRGGGTQNVTVNFNSTVANKDEMQKFVEEVLKPAMERAGDRNVKVNVAA